MPGLSLRCSAAQPLGGTGWFEVRLQAGAGMRGSSLSSTNANLQHERRDGQGQLAAESFLRRQLWPARPGTGGWLARWSAPAWL